MFFTDSAQTSCIAPTQELIHHLSSTTKSPAVSQSRQTAEHEPLTVAWQHRGKTPQGGILTRRASSGVNVSSYRAAVSPCLGGDLDQRLRVVSKIEISHKLQSNNPHLFRWGEITTIAQLCKDNKKVCVSYDVTNINRAITSCLAQHVFVLNNKMIKERVHPKIEMLSSFTRSNVMPNTYCMYHLPPTPFVLVHQTVSLQIETTL